MFCFIIAPRTPPFHGRMFEICGNHGRASKSSEQRLKSWFAPQGAPRAQQLVTTHRPRQQGINPRSGEKLFWAMTVRVAFIPRIRRMRQPFVGSNTWWPTNLDFVCSIVLVCVPRACVCQPGCVCESLCFYSGNMVVFTVVVLMELLPPVLFEGSLVISGFVLHQLS